MQSIHFLSYNAFVSNGASFQYRDDNLNFIDKAGIKPNATFQSAKRKPSCRSPINFGEVFDIWNGCGLLSYTSTLKDVYKILQKAKLSRFFVVKRNEMS